MKTQFFFSQNWPEFCSDKFLFPWNFTVSWEDCQASNPCFDKSLGTPHGLVWSNFFVARPMKEYLTHVYLRPWTLAIEDATLHVPHLAALDKPISDRCSKPTHRCTTNTKAGRCCHALAWWDYLQVSKNAKRLITNFLAAAECTPDEADDTQQDSTAVPNQEVDTGWVDTSTVQRLTAGQGFQFSKRSAQTVESIVQQWEPHFAQPDNFCLAAFHKSEVFEFQEQDEEISWEKKAHELNYLFDSQFLVKSSNSEVAFSVLAMMNVITGAMVFFGGDHDRGRFVHESVGLWELQRRHVSPQLEIGIKMSWWDEICFFYGTWDDLHSRYHWGGRSGFFSAKVCDEFDWVNPAVSVEGFFRNSNQNTSGFVCLFVCLFVV